MTSGAKLEMVSSQRSVGASMALFWAPVCSFWLSGILVAKVDNTQDDSWRGSFTKRFYLAVKPSHVGVNADGLACPLHRATVYSCQVIG
jgi:hypothetical protein